MVGELESPEVLAAALQPIIYMINRSTMEQFQQYILPFIKNIFQMPKSVQVNMKIFAISNVYSGIFFSKI